MEFASVNSSRESSRLVKFMFRLLVCLNVILASYYQNEIEIFHDLNCALLDPTRTHANISRTHSDTTMPAQICCPISLN